MWPLQAGTYFLIDASEGTFCGGEMCFAPVSGVLPASAAPCRFVNDTLQPVVAIELHRIALASARISRLLSQTSHLPSAQTLQLDVFILGIDSECMHGKELFKYLSLT